MKKLIITAGILFSAINNGAQAQENPLKDWKNPDKEITEKIVEKYKNSGDFSAQPATEAAQQQVPSGIFYGNDKQQLFAATFSEAKASGKGKLLKSIANAAGVGAAVLGKGMGAVRVIQGAGAASEAAEFVGEQVKVSLAGTQANLQIPNKRPVFYFQFSENENFNQSVYEDALFGETTSPNQFVLVKLDKGKQARELVVGKEDGILGDSRGIPDKYKIPFAWQQVSKGVFKVYPKDDLQSGEYGFMLSASGSTGAVYELIQPKIFDFSVK